MLMVTDYYQMDSVAALLLRSYIKMTNITHDPLSLLCALLHIFGAGHPYCANIASRMARVLDVHPSRITEMLRHRDDPLLVATTRFHKCVRDRLRATRYYSEFRTFTCDECGTDLRCKPIARYVYDLAIVGLAAAPSCTRHVSHLCAVSDVALIVPWHTSWANHCGNDKATRQNIEFELFVAGMDTP